MLGYDKNNRVLKISIDKIDQVIKAKNKGKNIIESCENDDHLDVAKKYIEYYQLATEDFVGTSELELDLLLKRKEVGV